MSKLHRLSPFDYLFLSAETERQPMHVGCLLRYKSREGSTGADAAAPALSELLSQHNVMAPFNYRLVTRWGMPHWLESAAVDVTQHVHHIHLPDGSGEQALLDLVGALHGRCMDRSLPLWQVWVISGLADRRYAVYCQIHHALLDGVSGVRMIANAHATASDARNMSPFWAPDMARKRSTALADTQDNSPSRPAARELGRRFLGAQLTAGLGLAKNWLQQRAAPDSCGVFRAPETPLNGRVSGSRRFVANSFSFPRIQSVARQMDGTVNDVLLVMISRALQIYLREFGDLPNEPLHTLIPVNLRDATSIGGNEVGIIRASLATHQDTIQDVIAEVKASVQQQKTLLGPMNKEAKQLYTMLQLFPMLGHVATGKLRRFQTANTLISNIPGSRDQLYWNGHEVEAIYPVSIALNECALNFTLLSYRDRIELGMVCCPARVPALHLLVEYLHQALAEIEQSQACDNAA